MILKESTIVQHLHTFIDNCDSDELARLAGEIFGGVCIWRQENCYTPMNEEDTYLFDPNEFYANEFDK